jgi:hypothetical protein
MGQQFEWDAAKSVKNARDHGVTFEEALTVFADPLARIFGDSGHSGDETREMVLGHSTRQRLVVVSFTERHERVRIISAREATVRERHDYEANTKESEGR